MIKKIEDSNGKELYPRGNITEVKKSGIQLNKPTYQITGLKYKLTGAGRFIMLAGIAMLIRQIDKPPDSIDKIDDWKNRQEVYGYIMGVSLVVGGISLGSSE